MGKKLEKHTGLYFRIIHNGIDRYFSCQEPMVKTLKLTHSQCGILRFLYEEEKDIFQKDVENEFQISGATASNTLKAMEKLELIVREPMPDDARKKKITLTSKGTAAHEQAIGNVIRLEDALVKGMSDEEVKILHELLERTIQNIDELTTSCGDKK